MDVNDGDDGGVDPIVLAENDAWRRLAALRTEHEDLDAAVQALEAGTRPDMIRIARLKKKKLSLRDEIVRLEDMLTPDIIA
jgi:hypothetical protein